MNKAYIKVHRYLKTPNYTIGKLYVNGEYICDTLEDTDRGLHQNMPIKEIQQKKIYGETAIPLGRYEVNMEQYSPKFGTREWAKPYDGKLPRLVNVPCWEGVLIHVGNTANQTLGCLLTGRYAGDGKLVESTIHFHKLMQKLQQYDEVEILIC